MPEPAITLTPAQIDFLSQTIDSFTVDTWHTEIAGYAGSDRHFIRVVNHAAASSFILVVWNSHENDWHRFLHIEKDVSKLVNFLPLVYAHDDLHGLILEEDCGTSTLRKMCNGEGNSDVMLDAYKKVIDSLILWQSLDPKACTTITARTMDRSMFEWESDYFATHCVTEYFGCDHLLHGGWHAERKEIAKQAAALPQVVIHRDFQSENILFKSDSVKFVDFQGARLGPAEYDLASLLFDPYISQIDNALVNTLVAYYYDCKGASQQPRDAFWICAVQRLMQALGAYGNLSIHKDKKWYREFIPTALGRLELAVNKTDGFAHIKSIINCCGNKLSTA
ncbi:MAG: phosphotransferase [Chitinivibrionales bacterium]|nr:phosphotransferase [Chitinivibrionales bacterium]